MFNRISILFLLAFLPHISSAQKVQTISGEYIYYAPKTISFEAARQTAIDRARIQALAEAFGTNIQSTTTTILQNNNSTSNIEMSTLATSEIKGEWLGDTNDPEVDFRFEEQMLVFTAKVWGQARKITSAPIDIIAKVLRNGTDLRFESAEFRAGDELFFFFQTPTSGYLAVYLIDDLNTAYCLLPYGRDPSGIMAVENNRSYLFFSAPHADKQITHLVDEYVITADKAIEYNHLYILFTPNKFTKANDRQRQLENQSLPRETSLFEFQRWLTRCRINDSKMVVRQLSISIQK